MGFYPNVDSLAENPLLNGSYENVPDDADASITAAGFFGIMGKLVALGTNGAGTVSRVAFTLGQTSVPGDPRYHLRWAQTTAATAGTPQFTHKINDVRTFAGRKVTWQGYYRSNVAIPVRLRQDFGTTGSPSADVNVSALAPASILPSTVDANGTAQWRPFALSFFLPSLSGKTLGTDANSSYVGIDLLPPLDTTFQFDICMMRLVPGGQETPIFRRRPYAMEEDELQRFYWTGSVQAQNAAFHVAFHRTMNIVPTMTASAGTADTATVDGFSLTHNAEAAVTIIADARIPD